MAKQKDRFGEWLKELSDLADRLGDYGVPDEAIEGFQKATAGLGPMSKQERLVAVGPICNHVLKCLRELKKTENVEGSSPVRTKQKMPRSLIERVAWELLVIFSDGFKDIPPLGSLMAELFDVGKYHQKASRNPEARDSAMLIMLLCPDLSTSDIARRLDIPTTTVTRWKNNNAFNAGLEKLKGYLSENPKWRLVYQDALRYQFLDNQDNLPELK